MLGHWVSSMELRGHRLALLQTSYLPVTAGSSWVSRTITQTFNRDPPVRFLDKILDQEDQFVPQFFSTHSSELNIKFYAELSRQATGGTVGLLVSTEHTKKVGLSFQTRFEVVRGLRSTDFRWLTLISGE